MGYPMNYARVVMRNRLEGDYHGAPDATGSICGDLRRLEKDTQDEAHIAAYALHSGATPDQVRTIFRTFFAGPTFAVPWPPHHKEHG